MMKERPPQTLTETSNFRPMIPPENAGKLSSLYMTSIEFRNVALEQKRFQNLDQVSFVRLNIAMFNIGMSFELIYKVMLLCDSGKYPKTHQFKKLHAGIESETKKHVELCIIESGWQSVGHFIRHLDEQVRHGDRRYYEAHSVFDAFWGYEPQMPLGLIGLHEELSKLAASKIWINPNLPY